jgi:hypothetical protein
MAKRKAEPVNATPEAKAAKPVRLDLAAADHERLQKQARRRGLTKASCVRMVILEWLEEQEGGSRS